MRGLPYEQKVAEKTLAPFNWNSPHIAQNNSSGLEVDEIELLFSHRNGR